MFPFAIFLICISQPFNLYVYGVFLIAYVLLRHFQTNRFTGKNIAIIFGQMAVLGILGMLLSAPFMIENIFQLLESPRGSGTNSYANILTQNTPVFYFRPKTLQLGTSVMRFFSSDAFGEWHWISEGVDKLCRGAIVLLRAALPAVNAAGIPVFRKTVEDYFYCIYCYMDSPHHLPILPAGFLAIYRRLLPGICILCCFLLPILFSICT